jgi:hypothetical protein
MRKRKKEKPKGGTAALGDDDMTNDYMKMLWARSQFGLFKTPESEKPCGSVLFLAGRVGMFPYHFVKTWEARIAEGRYDENRVLYLRSMAVTGSVQNSTPITLKVLMQAKTTPALAAQDLCSLEFPRNFTDRPIIIDKFVKGTSSVYKQDEVSASISMMRKGERRVYDFIPRQWKRGCTYDGPLRKDQYSSDRVWHYSFGCDDGDCGDVLLLNNVTTGKEKILGIHVCGDSTQGSSTAVTQEMANDLLKLWAPQVQEELIPNGGAATGGDFHTSFDMIAEWGGSEVVGTPANNQFIPIARLRNGLFNETRTEIRKAFELYEWKERLKAPAPIGARDAFLHAVEGYGAPAMDLDTTHIREAVHHTFCAMSRAVADQPKVMRRVLTDHEAVFGVKGDALPAGVSYTGLQPSSSAGWMPGDEAESGKPHKSTWFYTTAQGENVITPRGQKLLDRVNHDIAMLKQGKRPFFVYKNFLKDELLKKAKVEAGKARFISASPLDLQILFRKYFGMFCVFMTQGRVRNGSAIGVNPHSMEWDELVKILQSHKVFNAGDFAKYDTSLQRLIMLEICEAINRWYDDGPENATLRRTLFLEVVNSKHIYGQVIYEWLGSEPSGHPLTAVLNTIYTLVVFRLVFGLTNPKGWLALSEYDDHIFTISLGDDHVNAIDEYASEFYTPFAIKQAVAKYGMGYTTASKEEVTPTTTFQLLKDVTFLKRGIRWDAEFGRYMAPHDLDSLLETPLWVRGKTALERTANSKQTFDQIMHELSIHDTTTYDEWAPKLLRAYEKEFRAPFPIHTRSVLLQRVVSGKYFDGVW